MYSKSTKSPLFPQQNDTKNVEVEPVVAPDQENPEEEEVQQVNLGELGNYFDIVRNNYFEVVQ